MFPIVLPQQWHDLTSLNEHCVDPKTADWIASISSLTLRIKELGVAFSIDLLSQQPTELDAQLLGNLALPHYHGVSREVLLKQGNTPLVYAQTLIPEQTYQQSEYRLKQLGTQSLGQLLFQSNDVQRGPIQFAKVESASELGCFITQQLHQVVTKPTFIRRSVFHLDGYPLMVCECFLPALFE